MSKPCKSTGITDDLSGCINIGKDTEFKLKQVGIDTFEKLKSTGSEGAFIRLQTIDPGACLSLLCGLDGAIDGIKWTKLSPERKQELMQFYKMTKKK
jgi:DNA transformation protein and related proteins